MGNQYTDGWSDEEVDILMESVGVLTFDGIARKLKKTPRAVESKLDKLGMANTKFASGMITMHELSVALGIDDKVVKRWIDNKELPHIRKNFRYGEYNERRGREKKRLFYYINVDEFWAWAGKNKDVLNWHRVPEDALPPEPLWVNPQRKIDFYKWEKQRSAWSEEQDKLLWQYYYQDNLPQKQIAMLLGKTVSRVEKRLRKLREAKRNAN